LTALYFAFAAVLLTVVHAAAVSLLKPEVSVSPMRGAAIWMLVLVLRAVVVVSVALFVMTYGLSGTLSGWLPAWCVHTTLPVDQVHFGLSGHLTGEIARLVPMAMLIASLALTAYGVWRAGRGISNWLRSHAVGEGPAGSVIVSDPEMLIAAAGFRQPVVVVSQEALIELDDDELAAGLQHEWGHVRRRHRSVTFLAALLVGLSRPLPGGKQAFSRLRFFLERDADEYAVDRTGDPHSLARAICKVASVRASTWNPAIAGLGGSGIAARLHLLIDRQQPAERGGWLMSGATLTIAVTVFFVMVTFATLPLFESGVGLPHLALAHPTCA